MQSKQLTSRLTFFFYEWLCKVETKQKSGLGALCEMGIVKTLKVQTAVSSTFTSDAHLTTSAKS